MDMQADLGLRFLVMSKYMFSYGMSHLIFIARHKIVAGYYDFTLDIRVSVRPSGLTKRVLCDCCPYVYVTRVTQLSTGRFILSKRVLCHNLCDTFSFYVMGHM